MTTFTYARMAPSQWVVLCLGALALGCGAERKAHPDYGAKCDDGEVYKGFCLPREGSPDGSDGSDAGSDGSSAMDGGSGTGDDASVGEPCTTEDEVELCYDHPDRDTALQPPCRAGTRTCKNGVWSECIGQVTPKSESCNEDDDDCDGQSDEDLVASSCAVLGQAGICAQGVNICVGGQERCFQIRYATTETCDEREDDEDCDALEDSADPDLQLSCYEGSDGCVSDGQDGYTCQGICTPGIRRCVEGAYEAGCPDDVVPAQGGEAPTLPGEPALDEDCDSKSDEGIECLPDEELPCYTGPARTRGKGTCHDGIQKCSEEAPVFGPCEGEIRPAIETCADLGIDNDCDDELNDVPGLGTLCGDVDSENVCEATSTRQCVNDMLKCEQGPAQPNEVCDRRDNDCDNDVDEDFDLSSDRNHCGGCNIQCGAGSECCNGSCVNTQSSNAHCGGCEMACGSGMTCCGGGCVNTSNNSDHCGTCNYECELLFLVKTTCRNGTCQLL